MMMMTMTDKEKKGKRAIEILLRYPPLFPNLGKAGTDKRSRQRQGRMDRIGYLSCHVHKYILHFVVWDLYFYMNLTGSLVGSIRVM